MEQLCKYVSIRQPESNRALGLETESEYRQRWISIRVIYFTGFVVYIAFCCVATSLWPYLNTLDPDAPKQFLFYLFAIPSLMQLVLSPLFGYWTNRASSIRLPMMLVIVFLIVGQVLYAVIEEIPNNRKYALLASRALVGASTVACTLYRAYISAATTVAERTKTTSYMALAQTLGLVGGSAVQPTFAGIGEEGFQVLGFRVNMYTSVGWFCAALGVINLVLMLPWIFQDHNIAVKEAMSGNVGLADGKRAWQTMELRYLPIGLMLVAFALLMFAYAALQTLLSPIALDQFNWTNEESLFYLGILMTAGALISCILFLMLDPLCKRFSETNVLVYGAMLALFVSQLVMIPVGSEPITAFLENNGNSTGNGTALGCPPTQEWCASIPPIGKVQFTISYTLLCISFSIGTTLSQAVFSKLLGPRPQGTWMALLTCAGSAARILGPGAVTVYVLSGTYWTFGGGSVLTGLVFVWMWVYRNRLQPVVVVKPSTAEEMKVLNPSKLVQ
ncbi:major facilitator superfamily domain-containing protein 8-like isoform X1 [Culex pipiens pallens]|uniref:major facilitator superfamily domain-containing protein 8-like isoform X1 n=1 Tax=Culex pipiens pallens TaxID=42434 RepID=UPI001953797F|nr:major facilitator superfamily domain-containing protein 8-like isoform X1 [Culex pipiens pallens]